MGIYVMTASALKELLEQHMPDANDFGNEVIPGARQLGYPVQVRRPPPGRPGSCARARARCICAASVLHCLTRTAAGLLAAALPALLCVARGSGCPESLACSPPAAPPASAVPASACLCHPPATRPQAYAFQGYWEDIGTIEAFYNANLALVKTDGSANFSFYDKEAPIYTMSRFLPPSKVMADVTIANAIVGDGSLIKAGSRVSNSIIGLRSLISEDCVIEDTLMLGSDYYETMDECAYVPGCLPMGVGAGSHIRKALIDKNARIGERVQILNKDGVQEANREADGFMVRDGIVCVIKDSVIPSGTVI